jgi:acylphosphatase
MTEGDRRRMRVIVEGLVQGVFYRATCAAEAERADVGGFVRNMDGGGVEAVFGGPARAVEGMVEWCRRGPRGARVERIEIHEEQPLGERSFRIVG